MGGAKRLTADYDQRDRMRAEENGRCRLPTF